MKKYLLLALLLVPFVSFSQIDKIGYSKAKVVNSMKGDPCKSNYNEIWYCGENGILIHYTFKNNFVSDIMYMWEFKSKYEADEDVKVRSQNAKIQYGRPEMKGEQSFWFTGNYLILISYGYSNGKHYSCWRVSER